ncbi:MULTISPECIES: SAF domain-containing protein [unclassified Luteococcus]|uniref:SAF domain-containing protein n=1 Tax=unclassified Luteococcus TaxID=2639923 RepID=UPI00313D7A1B
MLRPVKKTSDPGTPAARVDLPDPTLPVAAHLRPRRSPRLVAAGLLLACLGGLGGALAYQRASHANQVVVVQHAVPRGELVRAQDLSVVTIGPAPGVHTVDANQLPSLVGKQALVDLPAGSLVGAGSVGQVRLAKGHVQLGLRLAPGRVPVEPMPAGTPVRLVEVTSDKQENSALVVEAMIVTAARTLPDGTSQMLDVGVPEAQAQRLADLSARDLLVVVRKAGG